MNKKGFTLTELLVVIAIIGIIAVIAVPSVILVRKNVNKRLYASKVEEAETAAKLYASNNPDLFNESSTVKVYIHQLIKGDYLNSDINSGTSECKKVENNASGCMINPLDKKSMNEEYILVTKETVGFSTKYNDDEVGNEPTFTGELVDVVCQKINNGEFIGKYGTKEGTNDKLCDCKIQDDKVVGIFVKGSSTPADACIISGTDVNNYLYYNNQMWRVIGLYNIYNDQSKIVAKMVTDSSIGFNN